MEHTPRSPSSYSIAAFIAFAIYVLLLVAAESHHAFWRDEAQAWLLARDSASPLLLLHNIRYEGHPPLWTFLLYIVSRFSPNPDWMKLINDLASIGAVWLIFFRTPFHLAYKLGIAFSYYLLFEYAVIDRNYMLGVVLLFAATTVLTRHPRSIAVPLLLALAVQTSLPALILACALFFIYFFGEFPTISFNFLKLRFASFYEIISTLIFVASTGLAVAIIYPPADSGVTIARYSGVPNAARVIANFGALVVHALLPFPRWTYRFWNTNFLESFSGSAFGRTAYILGWALAFGFFFSLRRSISRIFFLLAFFVLGAELIWSNIFYLRQVGFIFIAFIIALWLELAPDGRTPVDLAPSRMGSIMVAIVLTAQILASVFALSLALRYPFSQSRSVAEFLVSHHLDRAKIISDPDFETTAILAYLDRSAYFPYLHANGSFSIWSSQEFKYRFTLPTPSEMEDPASGPGQRAVLITEYPLDPAECRYLAVKPIAVFNHAFADDPLYLYH